MISGKPVFIDADQVFEYAKQGLGEASIAAMLQMNLTTFRKRVSESEELRLALESGAELCLEHQESTIMSIISDPSATNRDKVAAYSAWAKYNKSLTKRQIKAKAEALNELSTPELRAKLESLISRANDSSPDHNGDPLQQRLNS